MKLRGLAIGIAAWACVGFAGEAAACSPVRGARVLTNLELVQQAPTIVIGRVARWDRKQSPGNRWFDKSSIGVEVVKTLKGNGPQSSFRLDGMLALKNGLATPAESQPSAFDEFEEPHVNAYAGGCIRSNFVIGQLVVFFLRFEGGHWQPAGGIFSRWAEDVPSVNGPWVRLVQLYIEASQLPNMKRLALLRAKKAQLLAGKPDRIKRLMAEDIQRQIVGKRRSLGV